MKRAYFVRHGESQSNANRVFQSAEVGLSNLGFLQAEKLADKLTATPIDKIVASPFLRTKQTAEVINKKLNKEIIFTPLLQELKNPTAIIGKPYLDAEASKIKVLLNKKYNDIRWHHSDEENLYDLMQRGHNFLDYICKFKDDNILIVTHAGIMKMIIAVMIFGDTLNVEIFNRFNIAFDVNNTGITICDQLDVGKWRVLAWNDYLHLGSIKSESGQGD